MVIGNILSPWQPPSCGPQGRFHGEEMHTSPFFHPLPPFYGSAHPPPPFLAHLSGDFSHGERREQRFCDLFSQAWCPPVCARTLWHVAVCCEGSELQGPWAKVSPHLSMIRKQSCLCLRLPLMKVEQYHERLRLHSVVQVENLPFCSCEPTQKEYGWEIQESLKSQFGSDHPRITSLFRAN